MVYHEPPVKTSKLQSTSELQSTRTHHHIKEPTPPNDGGSAWLAVAGIALVGTFFAASWAGNLAASIGQNWVIAALGGNIDGTGGGDPPCKRLPSWVCSNADFGALSWGSHLPEGFTAAVMLLLFIGFFLYWLFLLLRLPLIPTWQNHLRLSNTIKPPTLLVIFVTMVSNSEPLMSTWGHLLITSKVWNSFIITLLGIFYVGTVSVFAPKDIDKLAESDANYHSKNRNKAPLRYFLSLLAFVYFFNFAYHTILLFPAALTAAPEGYNWWCVLAPWQCEL